MQADLDTFSLPELEELLVRIRAEIEAREQEPAPRPILRTRARRAIMEQAGAAIEATIPPPTEGTAGTAPVEASASSPMEATPAIDPSVAPAPGPLAATEADAAVEPPSEAVTSPAAPQAAEHEAEVVKYMHPSNRQLTWSGEGAKPAWVEIWLYTGGTLYALEVAAEKLRPRPKPSFAPFTSTSPSAPPSEEAQPQAKRRRPRRSRHTT